MEHLLQFINLSDEDRHLLVDLIKAQRMTISDGINLGVGFIIAPILVAIAGAVFIWVIGGMA